MICSHFFRSQAKLLLVVVAMWWWARSLSITSAQPGGGYATWSGTSMSSALAAGVAGLVRAANPTLPVNKVVKRLEDSATRLCGSSTRQIDAAAALDGRAQRVRACELP